MTSKNALVDASSFALVPITEDMAQLISEELDGLGQIPFDNVKIPSGGGLAFEVPGDDPEEPDLISSLTGVIVHHHAINTYWEHDYDGSGGIPDCSSADGHTGLDTRTGELRDCASCPYNQFGSGKGNSKACKNGHRIYLLRQGEALPVMLTLPPTSLRPFKDYIAKRIVLKGKRCSEVLTVIKLKKEKNSDNIVYSACVFSKGGDLNQEQAAAVRPTAAWIKSIAQKVPMVEVSDESADGQDHTAPPAKNKNDVVPEYNGDFIEIPEEDEKQA